MDDFIKCSYCGKKIYKGDFCLEHKCLVIGGFYNHYKSYSLSDEKIQEEVEDN